MDPTMAAVALVTPWNWIGLGVSIFFFVAVVITLRILRAAILGGKDNQGLLPPAEDTRALESEGGADE